MSAAERGDDDVPIITESDLLKLIISDEVIPPGKIRFHGGDLMSKMFLIHIASINRDKTCILINSKLKGMEQMNILVNTRLGEMQNANKFLEPRIQIPTSLNVFKEFLADCKKNNRMAIIPLGYIWPSGGHQNMVIYDPFLEVAEHFEPYGVKPIMPLVIAQQFEKAISKKLNEFFKFLGIRYIPPRDVCPFLGLQAVDEDKPLDKLDPIGFCVAWSYFFAEIRINNPEVDGDVLISEVFKTLGENPEALRNFIRRYANFFRTLVGGLVLSPADKQVFIDVLLDINTNVQANQYVDNFLMDTLKANANIKVI